jgi:hypothetical protein
MPTAKGDGMSDEPEDSRTFARILLAGAAVMLPAAIGLYCWRLEPEGLLEILRRGLTGAGLISLTFGLMHLYRGRKARRS